MNAALLRYGFLSLLVFIILAAFISLKIHLKPFLTYLVAINGSGFLIFSLDKLSALRSWMRAPEFLLHFLELLGATPAILLAQQLLWHKSTKRSYQIIFWLIVVIQAGSLYLIYYTDLLKMLF